MRDLVKALQAYMGRFDRVTARRGRGYCYNGQVREVGLSEDEDCLTGVVQGTSLYKVRITLDENGTSGRCSCPVGSLCKHLYALALSGTISQPQPGSLEAKASQQVAQPSVESNARLNAGVAGPARPEPARAPVKGLAAVPAAKPVAQTDGSIQERLRAALGRPLDKLETRYLQSIQTAHRHAMRGGSLSAWDLGGLVADTMRYGWEEIRPWPGHVPESEYKFLLYLVYFLENRGERIPDFVRTILDYSLVESEIREQERELAIERWTMTLQGVCVPSSSRPPLVRLRMVFEHSNVRLEEWNPAKGVYQVPRQARIAEFVEWDSTGVVGFEPDSRILLAMLRERGDAVGEDLALDLTDPEDGATAHGLLQHPLTRALLFNSDGRPLRISDEPLSLKTVPPKAPGGDYRLELVLPDGTSPASSYSVLPGMPTYYLAGDTAYPGPGREVTFEACQFPLTIPMEAMESEAGLRYLSLAGVPMPEGLARKVERLTVPVSIRCCLEGTTNLGAQAEAVMVRVRTAPPVGFVARAYTPHGWVVNKDRRRGGSQRVPGKIYVLDESSMHLLPGLIEPLAASYMFDGAASWKVRLTKNFPAKFSEWLAGLPKEVEVILEGELASFREEAIGAKLSLECTETEVDWFDLKVTVLAEDQSLTPEELKALLDAKGNYVRLEGRGWRRLEFDLTEEHDADLARLGLSVGDFSSEPQRLHALQLADKRASKLLPEAQASKVIRRAEELQARVTPPVPGTIRASLRPYQLEGFHFLAYLTTNRFGGILADDMGLGKTVQTLTWLAWLRAEPATSEQSRPGDVGLSSGGPSLVVCPKSVTDNWRAEAERFYPELRVVIGRGLTAETLKKTLAECDLLVLNYAQLRLLSMELAKVSWRAVILDEGQFVKNPESQTARAARGLPAQQRLVLSGTPIENRLMDLWSLMAFAMPGVLGTRARFQKQYNQGGDPLARRRLAARVRPFLLRRTKSEVAKDLPDRIEEDLLCEMEGTQLTQYKAEYKRARLLLLNMRSEADLNENRFHFLTSLLRLRQICCHPGLYDREQVRFVGCKVEALVDLLEPLMTEDAKVLVFSQFVEMLELLREEMETREWRHFMLTGDTQDRGSLVKEFQETQGAAVFLLSLKAGGFGLNLTAASYVVLFDPWWNPAVENQAIDRTHRIGQINKVMAYRLVVKDSIEEKIRVLQKQKQQLAEDVLGEESFARGLTLDDLKYLFREDAE